MALRNSALPNVLKFCICICICLDCPNLFFYFNEQHIIYNINITYNTKISFIANNYLQYYQLHTIITLLTPTLLVNNIEESKNKIKDKKKSFQHEKA